MMRVSQRLDCAVRAAVELARRPADAERISAGELAARIGLPRRFTEQQLTALGRAGIVKCRRGAGGGCALAREARDVTVAEIVRAVEGAILDVPRISCSASSGMWERASCALERELAQTTLADLAASQERLDATAAPMYHI